jgi:succinate dehydrogenase flavin-adding protein (antitoxin of CptAB toxin-antitoxin module)
LTTGKKRTPEKLLEQLTARFVTINRHAEDAEVSGNSVKKIQKAQRVVNAMVLTLKFFWCWVDNHVESLNLPDDMASVFESHLLPMAYIEAHLPKARNAEQRQQRRELHGKLEVELNDNEVWQLMTAERKAALKAEAKKCALVFQRSSSCVEGRNGQLSLKHHASRKMSPRKLAASTVIHNYFITRKDGTTAAERLFEQPPDDLFDWLLEHTDYPALSAQKRSKAGELRAVA